MTLHTKAAIVVILVSISALSLGFSVAPVTAYTRLRHELDIKYVYDRYSSYPNKAKIHDKINAVIEDVNRVLEEYNTGVVIRNTFLTIHAKNWESIGITAHRLSKNVIYVCDFERTDVKKIKLLWGLLSWTETKIYWNCQEGSIRDNDAIIYIFHKVQYSVLSSRYFIKDKLYEQSGLTMGKAILQSVFRLFGMSPCSTPRCILTFRGYQLLTHNDIKNWDLCDMCVTGWNRVYSKENNPYYYPQAQYPYWFYR